MNLLVTGGAGYIGSHFVRLAQNYDHKVTVLDNFSTGNIWAIKDCEVLEVDLLDKKKLSKSFKIISMVLSLMYLVLKGKVTNKEMINQRS